MLFWCSALDIALALMQEESTLKAFAFDIYLPDESSSRFYIFHDLAELFGEEFNYDALRRLRKLLAEDPGNPKRKLTSDHESDVVSLSASKPEVIWLVSRVINENSVPKYKKDYTDGEYEEVLERLKAWKRPKPKKWGTGDFFYFELSNGELAYGQVLGKEYTTPTCALFEAKSRGILSVEDIRKSRVISILHLGSDLLDKGLWKVIGPGKLVAHPDSSSLGKRGSVGTTSFGGGMALQELAEAYFGLAPWNVGYCGDDYYYDKQLMSGVTRPSQCLWLSEEPRKAYRAKHGITA
jgi:hypothetical protein